MTIRHTADNLPIVHDNGTSKQSLLDSRDDVYDALRAVLERLRDMAPNGRDYYPDPGRMERAVELHRARGQYVLDLMTAIEAEMDAIND